MYSSAAIIETPHEVSNDLRFLWFYYNRNGPAKIRRWFYNLGSFREFVRRLSLAVPAFNIPAFDRKGQSQQRRLSSIICFPNKNKQPPISIDRAPSTTTITMTVEYSSICNKNEVQGNLVQYQHNKMIQTEKAFLSKRTISNDNKIMA